MSKQYDVDDILNEIKAKKARQNASQSARAGRGSPAARPKPVNQNIEDLSSQAYRQPQPEPVTQPRPTVQPPPAPSRGIRFRIFVKVVTRPPNPFDMRSYCVIPLT